jgi:hypothetical protein
VKDEAETVTREVLALYTCGPAGGGGVRTQLTPACTATPATSPLDWLQPHWSFAA